MITDNLFNLVACHNCDLLHKVDTREAVGHMVRCTRCGTVLQRSTKDSLNRTLAFGISGLVLFIVANMFPVISIQANGNLYESTLLSGVMALYHDGMWGLTILVLLTSIVAPLLYLSALVYLLLPLCMGRVAWQSKKIFRSLTLVGQWEMVGVYIIGSMISIVRLEDISAVAPGVALFALGGVMFSVAAVRTTINPDEIWRSLERGSLKAGNN